jgi:hypothetical protein
MIVELSVDQPPALVDADRLDRLHATCAGDPESARYGDDSCTPGPDPDHVWVDVDWLRRNAMAQADDPTYGAQFDGMIAYATRKGWLDDTGTRVRAHIER